VIDNQDLLPKNCINTKTVKTPDKEYIKWLLKESTKEGVEVPKGCHLEVKQNMQIK